MTARRSGKERAALLQGVLLPDARAVLDRLREELKAYLPARDVAGAVDEVERRGWTSAQTVYEERGRGAKRDWCRTTGLGRHGSKLAADWRPDGWLGEFDAMSPEDAERAVEAARAARDELLRENAVGEAVLLAAETALRRATGVARDARDRRGRGRRRRAPDSRPRAPV